MVRAGVVSHPADWPHGGHQELSGARQRYRILNQDRLLNCLGHDHAQGLDAFRAWYTATLAQRLTLAEQAREAYWSQAYAVGSESWLTQLRDSQGLKRKTIVSHPIIGYDTTSNASTPTLYALQSDP